jgi:hypothetical protein
MVVEVAAADKGVCWSLWRSQKHQSEIAAAICRQRLKNLMGEQNFANKAAVASKGQR